MFSLPQSPSVLEAPEPERREIRHALVVRKPYGDVVIEGRLVIRGESVYNVSVSRELLEDVLAE